MESIVAAAISAIASVVVALIQRQRSAKNRGHVSVAPVSRQARSSRTWLVSVLVMLVWVVVAPRLTSQGDLLLANLLAVIPIASVATAWVLRPQPLFAASGVFAIHAVNAGLMSLSEVPGFMIGATTDVLLLLLAFTLNAALAAFAARWASSRQSRAAQATEAGGHSPLATSSDAQLPDDLVRLAKLRSDGLLTEEEYSLAKKKLLG